jgi:hypothetical protein
LHSYIYAGWLIVFTLYSRPSHSREGTRWFTFHLLFYPYLWESWAETFSGRNAKESSVFGDLRKDKLLFLQTFYTNLTTTKLSASISLTFNKIHFFLLLIKLPRDLLSTNVLQSILGGKPLNKLPLKAAG